MTIARADVIVADVLDEVLHETGDLLAAAADGVDLDRKTVSLADLVAGRHPGRRATTTRSCVYKSVGARHPGPRGRRHVRRRAGGEARTRRPSPDLRSLPYQVRRSTMQHHLAGSAGLADPSLLAPAPTSTAHWLAGGAAGHARRRTTRPPGTSIADLPALSRGTGARRRSRPRTARCPPGGRCPARTGRRSSGAGSTWSREHTEDLAGSSPSRRASPWPRPGREVAYAASFIEWFAEEAKRVRGDVIPAPEPPRAGSSCSRSRSACAPPSRRGTSPPR